MRMIDCYLDPYVLAPYVKNDGLHLPSEDSIAAVEARHAVTTDAIEATQDNESRL